MHFCKTILKTTETLRANLTSNTPHFSWANLNKTHNDFSCRCITVKMGFGHFIKHSMYCKVLKIFFLSQFLGFKPIGNMEYMIQFFTVCSSQKYWFITVYLRTSSKGTASVSGLPGLIRCLYTCHARWAPAHLDKIKHNICGPCPFSPCSSGA